MNYFLIGRLITQKDVRYRDAKQHISRDRLRVLSHLPWKSVFPSPWRTVNRVSLAEQMDVASRTFSISVIKNAKCTGEHTSSMARTAVLVAEIKDRLAPLTAKLSTSETLNIVIRTNQTSKTATPRICRSRAVSTGQCIGKRVARRYRICTTLPSTETKIMPKARSDRVGRITLNNGKSSARIREALIRNCFNNRRITKE